MKTYVTFGQDHIHKIDEIIFDKDCVAVIDGMDQTHGRKIAVETFGMKFCTTYTEESWDDSMLHYFPRGFVGLN